MIPKVWSLNHWAAVVFNSTFPKDMPTPNTIIVPQGIRLSASFQDMTPILGVNIIANANKMIEDESKGCNIFSVDQSINKMMDMLIRRHSLAVIVPIAFNCC